MKLKFSWLKSRKSLIFSSFVDLALYFTIFFEIFRDSFSDKYILLILTLLNTFTWITSSYIFGRYTNFQGKKLNILLTQFIKTLLIISFNLLVTQVFFRLFWSWDYMNFESFSNFLNNLLTFYKVIFISSGLSQFLINYYLSKKFINKSIWLFLGSPERENYLNQIIESKTKFRIINFDDNNNNNDLNLKGLIIDNEEIFKNKNIDFLFKLNNKGMKIIKTANWCERYLNKYPSELVKVSEIIEGRFSYNEYSFKARIKRIVESILSLIILFLTFPILVIAGLLIKLEDGGPIFYSQIRNGFEGSQFKIIKLRTMITNAEKNGEQWADKSDSRITRIGVILRKLRIDELPQLLLVLSGEMSLIGPRPERPKIDKMLRDYLPNYDLRYSIKPGISGWAQVNYPYGASIEDAKLKLSYDLYYIKNFSILLDFMIFFKTLRLILNGKGSSPKKKQDNLC